MFSIQVSTRTHSSNGAACTLLHHTMPASNDSADDYSSLNNSLLPSQPQHSQHTHRKPALTLSLPNKHNDSSPAASATPDALATLSPSSASPSSVHHPNRSFLSSLVPFTTADMSSLSVFYYACGHMLNDLCAACWFTYLLVMLRDAHGLLGWKSAVVLLCGQVADAIATPSCGLLSDRSKGFQLWRWRLERRQTWYVIGTVLVAINFFLIFGVALPKVIKPDAPEWSLLLYFSVAASLFNVGWAAVQVSHMSMVPELSKNEHTRVVLNSARYSESVIANVAVFGILALWSELVSETVRQYTYVSYTTLAIGLLCSFLFLYGIREKPARRRRPLSQSNSNNALHASLASSDSPSQTPSPEAPLSPPPTTLLCGRWEVANNGWQMWLCSADFYRVGWVYMCTRVVVNVSQVFLVFYVLDTLMMDRLHITTVPCTVYVSSFVAALVMKRLNATLGRKVITAVGTMFCTLALIILYFLTPTTAALIYIPAILLGIGNGTVTVQATQLEADLIGRKTEHGAFVYGAMSFTDKLANGIALFALQTGNMDVDPSSGVGSDPQYIRLCEVVLPFIASVCAMLMVVWGIDIERMIANGKDTSGMGDEYDDDADERTAQKEQREQKEAAEAGDSADASGEMGRVNGGTVNGGRQQQHRATQGTSYVPPAFVGDKPIEGHSEVAVDVR